MHWRPAMRPVTGARAATVGECCGSGAARLERGVHVPKLRAVGVDPAFLAAEVEAVASLVDRDELAVAEEEVFDAVVRWV